MADRLSHEANGHGVLWAGHGGCILHLMAA